MAFVREFVISKADEGRKLEKWLIREMPAVGIGQRKKFFRLKRYKLNGRPAKEDARLTAGDALQIYLNDELFEKPRREDPFLSKIRPALRIVYEDENLLIVDKKPGLSAHPDANEKVDTLITHAQAYLYQKGEYDPAAPDSFAPALCNRLDRFTGGLEIIARNRSALDALNRAIREREIRKYYLCVAFGHFKRREGMLDGYIVKRDGARKVEVSLRPVPGGQHARTRYRVLAERGELTLLSCELLTGRTHQIRAQLAYAGHPLLGDGQYGDPRRSERYHRGYQALCAYRLHFALKSDPGPLTALADRSFTAGLPGFVRQFFPDTDVDALIRTWICC